MPVIFDAQNCAALFGGDALAQFFVPALARIVTPPVAMSVPQTGPVHAHGARPRRGPGLIVLIANWLIASRALVLRG